MYYVSERIIKKIHFGGMEGICLALASFVHIAIGDMASRRTYKEGVIRNIVLVQENSYKDNP